MTSKLNLRRKKTLSSMPFEMRKSLDKEILNFVKELGGNCLVPPQLAMWIKKASESGELDSVYLTPVPTHALLYRYKFVRSDEAKESPQFLTLSARGVNEFWNFRTEVRFVPLDLWVKEFHAYESLVQVPFFSKFKLMKSFMKWRKIIRIQKIHIASQAIVESSCLFGNRYMSHCFTKLHNHLVMLGTMGITDIPDRTTKHINDFFTLQKGQIGKFQQNFESFRTSLVKMILDACKTNLGEKGFKFEEYQDELNYYLQQREDKGRSFSPASVSQELVPKPRKMTFIEQANKRKCCLEMIHFIRLADFVLRQTLQKLIYNSMIAIQKAIIKRGKNDHNEETMMNNPGSHSRSDQRGRSAQKSASKPEEDLETELPLFSLTVGVSSEKISYTPDISVFLEVYQNFLRKLNETIGGVSLLQSDPTFYPVTQPILYGRKENYIPNLGSLFFDGHDKTCEDLLGELKTLTETGFGLCDSMVEPLKVTAFEFCKSKEKQDSTVEKVETDVEVLKSTLSHLKKQHSLIKNIHESRHISFFKVDFRLFKRTVLPNISSAITRLQESLPKVGREKMEDFNESVRQLKEMIEFEPKTTDDYVQNMDLVDRMNERYDLLETKLQGIDNVYGIMSEIPIPISPDDKSNLKSLKSTMNTMALKVQDKLQTQESMMSLFQEELEFEEKVLRQNLNETLMEVKNPSLVDGDASMEEIKPFILKTDAILRQMREKVEKYNNYEVTYGFERNHFEDLEQAETILAALETIWKCVEQWDRLYDEWSSINFDQLNIDACLAKTSEIKEKIDSSGSILGSNTIIKELSTKVELMLTNIPCLYELKKSFLKERHWKLISEIVGSEIKGHKISLGFLEQSKIFAYTPQIVRVVKTAENEENLAKMVHNLEQSWTGQKIQMIRRHDCLVVKCFADLYETISTSLTTLKQLGSSQYSAEMKDQLQNWFEIVHSAQRFVDTLKSVQTMWVEQVQPFSSLMIMEECPNIHKQFSICHRKAIDYFDELHKASSLVEAFDNGALLKKIQDLKLEFESSQINLDVVIHSLRLSSPRLFFLSKTEVLRTIDKSQNDIRAMELFLLKVFPWFLHFIVREGTDCIITKRGYSPEILGVICSNNEDTLFVEPLKIRLDPDCWIKFISNSMRQALRSDVRRLCSNSQIMGQPMPTLLELKDPSMNIQVALIVLHVSWCQFLKQEPPHATKWNAIEQLKSDLVMTLKARENPLTVQKHKSLLQQVCYYEHLDLDGPLPIRFSFIDASGVVRIATQRKSYIFGYERSCQDLLFHPFHAQNPALELMVQSKDQSFMAHLNRSGNALFQDLANIWGRPYFKFVPGLGTNLEQELFGALLLGGWMLIPMLKGTDEQLLLKTLVLKWRLNNIYPGSHLNLNGVELRMKGGTFMALQRNEADEHAMPINLRPIEVLRPSLELTLKWALTAKGFGSPLFVADLGYVIRELTKQGRTDSLRKFLIAIKYATKDNINHIYDNFLDLGGLEMIQKLSQETTWPLELTNQIEKQIQTSQEVRSSMEEERSLQNGDILAKNFNLLVNSLKVSSLLYSSDTFSLTMKHCLALLATKLKIEGNAYLQVCFETQLRRRDQFRILNDYLQNLKCSTVVIVILGPLNQDHVEQLARLWKTLRHIKLRIILIKTEVDAICSEIHEMDSLRFTEDPAFIVSSIQTGTLSTQVTDSIEFAHMEWFNQIIIETSHALTLVEDSEDFIFLETLSTTIACLLNQQIGDVPQTKQSLVRTLCEALFLLTQVSKLRPVLTTISHHLEQNIGICRDSFEWQNGDDIFERIISKHLLPQLSLENGTTDFFVPTKEIDKVAKTAGFLICNQRNVLIFGDRGAGKSIVIDKVLDILPPKTRILFLRMGSSGDFSYEDAALHKNQVTTDSVIIVQGFTFGQSHHLSYIKSLVVGRFVFDENAEKYVELPKVTLLIEANGPEKFIKPCLEDLRHDVIALYFRKSFDNDDQILSKALEIFAQDYSEEIQKEIQEFKAFLIGFHKFMKKRFPAICDHQLYRVISGMYGANPDEISTLENLGIHVMNEIRAEYSVFYQQADLSDLVQEFSAYYHRKFFNSKTTFHSVFSSNETGCHVEMKTDHDLERDLELSYDHIKGELFNDQIVMTKDFKDYVTQFCRSFQRFHTTLIMGGPCVGKSSLTLVTTNFLELDVKTVKSNDIQDFKMKLVQAYQDALSEKDTVLKVELQNETFVNVLEIYEAFLFYFDIPGAFDGQEKEAQLYDSNEEVYEALCNATKTDEATNNLRLKIQEQIHVIFSFSSDLFDLISSHYPYMISKSGCVFIKDWSMPTLSSIAQERLSDVNVGSTIKDNLQAVLVRLHQVMLENGYQVTTTHFLDLLTVFPKVFVPEYDAMVQEQDNLKSGIRSVTSANSLINKLSGEVTKLEPEVHNLILEIEQLNKQLTQEKMNLDRASKAFRRTEVAARKKSEETQELAADAHRNLEHALPSLEAAMEAISLMDRTDISELKQMKNPPELLQQVFEAVCILLGLKADWNTAKVILGDSYFQQKLIEIDKDNIPEQICKRVRRYIDNPKFIPDEVAKVSKLGSFLCMWVRAIDLYTKIFKSIEPKRIKLLQAESELADLMTALRTETDRVAHTETTIGTIQSQLANRTHKKNQLEYLIKETNAKLERAQILSYSLEEECRNWQKHLSESEEKMQWLCGESILISMIVTSACWEYSHQRESLKQLWKSVCDLSGFPTKDTVSTKEFLKSRPLKSWFLNVDYYRENYLSILHSNKWSLMIDPHGIGIQCLKDQNPSLLVLDFHSKTMVEQLRFAVAKGSEVVLANFEHPFDPEVKNLFEKRLSEKVHAFVGLVGIPVIRKDMRVIIEGQEIICHSKFNLHFNVRELQIDGYLRKYFNIVRFEFIPEALSQHLGCLTLSSIDPSLAQKGANLTKTTKELKETLTKRKREVLSILLNSQDSILDDSELISALKEAKARVFETMNDLTHEKAALEAMTTDLDFTTDCSKRIQEIIRLFDVIHNIDPSFDFLPSYVFDMIQESKADIQGLLSGIVENMKTQFLPSVHINLSFKVFVLMDLIKLPSMNLNNTYLPIEEILRDPGTARLDHLLEELFGSSPSVEDLRTICQNQLSTLVTNIISRIESQSQTKPIILLTHSEGQDGSESLIHLTQKNKLPEPIFVQPPSGLTFKKLNHLLSQGAKEERWVIFLHAQGLAKYFHRLRFPNLSRRCRYFFVLSHQQALPLNLRGKFQIQTLPSPEDLPLDLEEIK